VVSHDRYFLNRVCTSILAFEGDGVVRYQVGNYDYYLEKRAEAGIADPGAARQVSAAVKKTKARKLKYKEERELEGMEAAILAAESEVARIETLFATPDFYIKHAADLAGLEKELSQARAEVARLYSRWTELSELAAAN
jgi:ATP-binding cassette subfamily F protein uup